MKLEFQSRWLRLLIEFFPAVPAIRRYRVTPPKLDCETGRLLRRRIKGAMRQHWVENGSP